VLVLSTLFGMCPFLEKLFADGGYQGQALRKAAARVLPHLKIDLVVIGQMKGPGDSLGSLDPDLDRFVGSRNPSAVPL
jgi:hypothetical protein